MSKRDSFQKHLKILPTPTFWTVVYVILYIHPLVPRSQLQNLFVISNPPEKQTKVLTTILHLPMSQGGKICHDTRGARQSADCHSRCFVDIHSINNTGWDNLKHSEALNSHIFYNSNAWYAMGLACLHWFRMIACLQARQKLTKHVCSLSKQTDWDAIA